MTLVQQIEEHVEGGVCQSIEEIVEELGYDYNKLSINELHEIDSAVFNCDVCGWTQPTENLADNEDFDLICQDCNEEEDED